MAANPLDLLADLIARARAAGADAADARADGRHLALVQRRLGKTEHVERAEGRDLGLRVFLGKRRRSSPPPMDPAASPTWPNAPSRWRGWCRRTRSPASPTRPRPPAAAALDLEDPPSRPPTP